MAKPPQILGILNITEDSFSDGGQYLGREAALMQARKLIGDGADVIDIGAAASNPDAKEVSAQEEIRRFESVVPALLREGVSISIDSFQSKTQAWAIEQFDAGRGAASSLEGEAGSGALCAPNPGGGYTDENRRRSTPLPNPPPQGGRGHKAAPTHYLNDIHGFADPALYPRLADARDVKLIVMHAIQSKGVATRERGDPETIWHRILGFFEERIAALEAAGIARERLILDPGMGLFLGAGREVSFRVLREIHRLKDAFDLPVLVSVSRKSFLRAALGRTPAESGPATLAAELFAAAKGASYIRTHDVRALKDASSVTQALAGEGHA